MESRAKAGTGNIINSLKGLYLQPLQRLFAFASAEFTPAFYGATKSSDKEHLSLWKELTYNSTAKLALSIAFPIPL